MSDTRLENDILNINYALPLLPVPVVVLPRHPHLHPTPANFQTQLGGDNFLDFLD